MKESTHLRRSLEYYAAGDPRLHAPMLPDSFWTELDRKCNEWLDWRVRGLPCPKWHGNWRKVE